MYVICMHMDNLLHIKKLLNETNSTELSAAQEATSCVATR
jgi:hypothetical protein